MDWTTIVWRLLCLLVVTSALLLIAGVEMGRLSERWLVIPAVLGLVVMVLFVVAWLHDCEQRSVEGCGDERR